MKRIFFCLCLILPFTVIPVSANNHNDSLMNKGNEAYQHNDYKTAAACYHQVVDNGNEGAVLFYNLGNACFKSGEVATAILWYERALRLDPSNEDIKHNIAFAELQTVDKIEVLPDLFLIRWWNDISQSQTANAWAVCSIVLCSLFILSLIGFLVLNRRWMRSSAFTVSLVALCALIFSLIFAHKEHYRYQNTPEAVIMQAVVNAKSTPNDSGSDLFVVHEGLKVVITDKLNEWTEIKLPNGEKGWVTDDCLEVI